MSNDPRAGYFKYGGAERDAMKEAEAIDSSNKMSKDKAEWTPTSFFESWVQDRKNWSYIDKCVEAHDTLVDALEQISELTQGTAYAGKRIAEQALKLTEE